MFGGAQKAGVYFLQQRQDPVADKIARVLLAGIAAVFPPFEALRFGKGLDFRTGSKQ